MVCNGDTFFTFTIQTKICDGAHCNKKIEDFKTNLKYLRVQFESFWVESVECEDKKHTGVTSWKLLMLWL